MGTVSSLRQQGVVQFNVLKDNVLLIYFYKKGKIKKIFLDIAKQKIKLLLFCLVENSIQFFGRKKQKGNYKP
jgi:hypothetical protein